jgi:hypothetical protein
VNDHKGIATHTDASDGIVNGFEAFLQINPVRPFMDGFVVSGYAVSGDARSDLIRTYIIKPDLSVHHVYDYNEWSTLSWASHTQRFVSHNPAIADACKAERWCSWTRAIERVSRDSTRR